MKKYIKKQLFEIKRFHKRLYNEFEWAMDEAVSFSIRKIRSYKKREEIKHWIVFE